MRVRVLDTFKQFSFLFGPSERPRERNGNYIIRSFTINYGDLNESSEYQINIASSTASLTYLSVHYGRKYQKFRQRSKQFDIY